MMTREQKRQEQLYTIRRRAGLVTIAEAIARAQAMSPPCIYRQEHTSSRQIVGCRSTFTVRMFGCEQHKSCTLRARVSELRIKTGEYMVCSGCRDRTE